MVYQWQEPFVVDDAAFRARFDARPTDVGVAAAETARWAVQHYRAVAG